MEISNYGIRLRRLTADKIELVRNWRNDSKIQQYMEYREYISPEMQTAWFNRINNENNFYFLIIWDEKEIGLINIKDIDYSRGVCEPGIFIYQDEYLDSDVAIRAFLCLNDFMWNTLKLNTAIIHVMHDNYRAIKFNEFLGYKLVEGQDGVRNKVYMLTVEDSLLNSRLNKIRDILNKQRND